MYTGTDFQLKTTLSTFSDQPPTTLEYHSGITGRSLNRTSCAWSRILFDSSVEVAEADSLRSESSSALWTVSSFFFWYFHFSTIIKHS